MLTLHANNLYFKIFLVMYNNYIEPRGLIHNSSFLKHTFMPTMLDALGLHDSSGVIFEVVEHGYFNSRYNFKFQNFS